MAGSGRLTVDRLIGILNRLGSRVEVKVTVRRPMWLAPVEDRAMRRFVSAAAQRILERVEW
jgi:hypothetical protein